jgi:hypothetical protein
MTLRFSPARGAGALSLYSMTRGPQGAAATLTAGTTTTAAAGTSAAVSNSGSTSAAVFDFTIPRGADAGIKWLYDSTTSMADPGTGDIRFNNATLASVTAIAVSATGSGSDVSDYVALWDDSTNTTKGHILIREEAGAVAALFAITSVTDNSTWLELAVTYVAGSLSLTASDPLYVTPLLIGNKGTDGALAGSVGTDDNGVPRANGTGGTTLQSSLVAIDDSGNITPKTTDVGALGTSLLNWADLFLDSGAVINFDSGDVLLTHSANDLALSGGTFTLPNTGLHLLDTNASHDLIIAPGSNLTADHTLTLTTGDADRTLDISAGSVTVSAYGATLVDDADAATALTTLTARGQGKETIWIPASAMWARTTNGPAAASRELTTGGDIMIKGWAFDTTTEEGVQFYIAFPKSWNKGTITFQAFWTNVNGLTTETVSWGLSAGAFTNDDPIDSTDLGTEVRVSDTWLAANDMHVTAESGAVTVGNTPIDDDLVIGQIVRSVANDNMTGDAELLGVKIFFTTNVATDA